MGKSYILVEKRGAKRRLDCQDLKKIYFAQRKINPPLPKIID